MKKATEMPKKARKREKPERRFDWRVLVGVVILGAMVGVGWFLNTRFEGVSVGKFINALAVDDGDEKINWGRHPEFEVDLGKFEERADFSGVVEINKAGTYRLSGVLEDGMVYVSVKNTEAKLVLDGVTIRNSTGPAIYVEEGEDVVIELIGENYVEDGALYTEIEGLDEKVNGAIYSRQDLTFTGEGSLTVVGQFADGIVSKDDLKFESGRYVVSARDDGVRGTDSVRVIDGDLTVTAGMDAIKATNGEKHGKGFVLIEGGTLDLTARGKGVEAVETALIRGGKLKISANEGIEARMVVMDGGEIEIMAIDDGLNAKSDYGRDCLIYMAGGAVSVYSSGDGLDANGKILVTGGSLSISVPKHEKNEALDADYGVEISEGVELTVIER